MALIDKSILHYMPVKPPNGVRYWRWVGRGLCLGAGKMLEKAARLSSSSHRPVRAVLGGGLAVAIALSHSSSSTLCFAKK